MTTTTLGRSGLEVSRIAFGTWQLGGDWGQFDEDMAVAAIRRARELGVNFFDTAQAYGFGASERLLGRALRPELSSRRREVVIATRRVGKMVEIEIADTGPGIAPRHMESLFSEFMTTKSEGLGLGLPISRTIVEAHGGQIWGENRPGGGAVFRFTLPRGRTRPRR